jgi:hypothetical protein
VELSHEKGSFSGEVTVGLGGAMNKAKVTWNSTIRNTSTHKIFRAVFCVKAVDSSGEPIAPGADECLLRMTGSNWESGVPLSFRGSQDVRLSDYKAPARVAKYTVSLIEIFDSINLPTSGILAFGALWCGPPPFAHLPIRSSDPH